MQSGAPIIRPMPLSISATQASCASWVTSTSAKPPSSACLMVTAIVRPESVRLCGMFEIRFAPWVGCTKKAFGKPRTWMPCLDLMPSPQASDRVSPSLPVTSKPERRL